MKNLSIIANAKINLTLGITGKREDGYHCIESIMQSINISDKLQIALSDLTVLTCNFNELENDNNICLKAAELFHVATGLKGNETINVFKDIPCCAGLGGGSADAAAVLLGLNKLYKTNLSYESLCEIGLKLGADVPFFIRGGTQFVTGIGEKLQRISPLNGCFFIIVLNGKKKSTKEMYNQIDKSVFTNPNNTEAIEAINKNELKRLGKLCCNSFESVYNCNSIKQVLRDSNPLAVSLSGSGPAVFAMYDSLKKVAFAQLLLKNLDIPFYFASPTSNSVYYE